MTPLVSVITPVYNCSRYVAESIDSIQKQSFRDYEHIISNDGSTDDGKTEKAVSLAIRGSRGVIYLPSSENKKIPARRTEMIKQAAKGKYIAIHDGDDVSLPGRLESQVEFLESHPDVFCVGSHAYKIDLDSEFMLDEYGGRVVMDYPPEGHEDIVNAMASGCSNPMIDPTTMFRREDLLNLNGYSLEKAIYTVPDFDLWLRAVEKGLRFANIQEPLVKYRTNPEGMTGGHKQEMIAAHMVVWCRFMRSRTNQSHYALLEKTHLARIRKIQAAIEEA